MATYCCVYEDTTCRLTASTGISPTVMFVPTDYSTPNFTLISTSHGFSYH